MPDLPRPYQQFRMEHPDVWKAYEELGGRIAQEGPLEAKVRELIKLGMAASQGSESAVHSHTHRALEAGAAPPEIEQAILLGITTIGFPTTMAALNWAKAAIKAHQP